MNRKQLIDIGLVIIILAMAVLVYFQVSRLFTDVRGQFQATDSPADEVVAAPTLTPAAEKATVDGSPSDFSLASVDGETVSLSDFQGTAVMINFWATWCPPCRAELPLIEAYANRHAEQLVVLAVNAGEEDDVVARFVAEFDYDLVFLLDSANSLAAEFQVRGLPTSIFIDADGTVKARHIGLLDESLLREYLGQAGVVE